MIKMLNVAIKNIELQLEIVNDRINGVKRVINMQSELLNESVLFCQVNSTVNVSLKKPQILHCPTLNGDVAISNLCIDLWKMKKEWMMMPREPLLENLYT